MSQTSKSKQPQYTKKIDPRETGTWVAGIRNQEMLTLFGELISDWVHVEEAMIDVIVLSIFPDSDIRRQVENRSRGFLPGRQIFRPISSNGTRAKVMVSLLTHFPGNDRKKSDPIYERIVSEFQSLVALRNDYLHGLWWTKHTSDVYLQTENVEQISFNQRGIFQRLILSHLSSAQTN
jgi:hypothetical protein